MASKNFQCTVITPESAALKAEISAAVIPAYDGEIGILRDHAPLLCRLGVGILRLETAEGPKRLYLDAGFAELLDNDLSILTEQALTADKIDTAAEQAALQEARDRKAVTPIEHAARNHDIARASAKLKLATG